MFLTRLLSGIVPVILALVIVGKGGALLFLVSAAVSLIGMYELCRVMGTEKSMVGLTSYAAGILYYALLWMNDSNYVTLMAIAALMALMAIYVLTFPKIQHGTGDHRVFRYFLPGGDALLCLPGARHGRRDLSGVADLHQLLGLRHLRLLRGRALGKHKLAPVLSPKKSIEGAVGGVVGAALLGSCMRSFTGIG